MRNFVLTSEAATAAHPDKLCDRISDAVVDASLTADPRAPCVAECALASGIAFLSIRHAGALDFDPTRIARELLAAEAGADAPPATVMLDTVRLDEAGAPEADAIAARMTTAFGYACAEGPDRMPWAATLARRLADALEHAAGGPLSGRLSRDGQAQAAVRYADRRATAVEAVALSVATPADGLRGDALESALTREVSTPALTRRPDLPAAGMRRVVQRRTGSGGPRAHAGLTGRKTSADGYGGICRFSGSALSGKDPSRADRSAAYAARQAAVSVVAAGLAAECEVQLSYLPGESAPATVEIDVFGSGEEPEREIAARLSRALDFRLEAVIERLGLRDLPRARAGRFYADLARGAHFGRPELDLPWDRPLPLT